MWMPFSEKTRSQATPQMKRKTTTHVTIRAVFKAPEIRRVFDREADDGVEVRKGEAVVVVEPEEVTMKFGVEKWGGLGDVTTGGRSSGSKIVYLDPT